MNDFYVYAHVKNDGTPFYVGKGRGSRVHSKTRSMAWKRVVISEYRETRRPNHVLLAERLDEQTAFDLEKYWIALWGRRGIHPNGVLVNHTDGGEGVSGRTLSKATRKKISLAHKNKPKSPEHRRKMLGRVVREETRNKLRHLNTGTNSHRFGTKHTDQTRKKMSQSHLGIRPTTDARQKMSVAKTKDVSVALINIKTGESVVVTNMKRFAVEHDLNYSHVVSVINGKRSTHKQWTLLKP